MPQGERLVLMRGRSGKKRWTRVSAVSQAGKYGLRGAVVGGLLRAATRDPSQIARGAALGAGGGAALGAVSGVARDLGYHSGERKYRYKDTGERIEGSRMAGHAASVPYAGLGAVRGALSGAFTGGALAPLAALQSIPAESLTPRLLLKESIEHIPASLAVGAAGGALMGAYQGVRQGQYVGQAVNRRLRTRKALEKGNARAMSAPDDPVGLALLRRMYEIDSER